MDILSSIIVYFDYYYEREREREREWVKDVNSQFTGLLNGNDNARFDKRGKWWARMNFEKIAIPAG